MSTLQTGVAPANPTRIPALEQDFAPVITANQFKEFQRERWPTLSMAIPLATSLAMHGRADLLEKAKGLAGLIVNEEGEDGLIVMLRTVESAQEFCEAQADILRSIYARLLIVADDMLIAHDGVSALAEMPNDFDPAEWIKRAEDAGVSMFVRDDELWIGSVVGVGRSTIVDQLKDELDDDAKAAVREILASRGLSYVEG
jgi:hypothetical protein